MSNIEQVLSSLATRVKDHAGTMVTEEAVKTAVILPLLQGLGYDVFDPAQVIPEFTADAVGKKGEKVDYAIKLDGEIAILIEAKSISVALEPKHLSQLYRYFSVTKAKFAILTNGRFFQFYSDLEDKNKLDNRPFFTLDLLDHSPSSLNELRKFERGAFDIDRILATAERLKYVSTIKAFLTREFEAPGDDLVKFVASEVHDGRLTASVRETIASATKTAYAELVRDAVRTRLSTALDDSTSEVQAVEDEEMVSDIETTQDEVEGMLTIRAIVRDIVKAERVGLRDAKSYCAVLVDDNNRKPLARMHFNRKQWYLGLFDTDREERVPVSGLDGLYDHADRLRAAAQKYAEE